MTAPHIAVVVVHWRGMEDLLECLRSLAGDAARGIPVLVAVNAGGDFDEPAAKQCCPGLQVVRAERNGGYAAACNLGWRALPPDGRPTLFLNNDVIVEQGAIDSIAAAFAARRDVGIAGPPIVYDGDPSRVWALGGRLFRARGYTRHVGFGRARPALPDAGAYRDYVNGSAIAARRDVLDALGGWDESYFHFWDEVDLCERAARRGWRSYLTAGPAVRHKVSATTGNRGSARFTRAQAYYFARNRVRFFARRASGWRRITALAMQPVLVAIECAQAALRGDAAGARGRIEGLVDGARGVHGQRRGGW